MRLLSPLLSALAVAVVAVVGGTSPASAQDSGEPTPFRGQVVVLKPPNVDEVTRTALARITGELTAARFQVSVVPLDRSREPTAQVESVAPELSPIAAFAIVRAPDSDDDTITIWVCDRLGRRTTIQRVRMRGNDVSQDAEVLAVEAIELIRVSIAGLWPTHTRAGEHDLPVPGASGSAERTEKPPVQPSLPRVRQLLLGVGGGALQDVGLSSTQWLAALDAAIVWPVGIALRAQLRGLGPGDTISGSTKDDGSAAVQRQLMLMGAAWVFWSEERVQSLVGLSLGAAHVSAEGAYPDRARAHALEAWSFAGSCGLGAALRLGPHLALALEFDAIVNLPSVNLSLNGTSTKALSAPGILTNVLLQARY